LIAGSTGQNHRAEVLVAKWPSLSTSRSRHQAADAQHATRGYAVPIVVDLPDLGNADNALLRHQRAVRYLKPDAVDAHAILRAGPLVALVVLSINALLSLDLNPRRPVRVLQPTWRRQTSSRDRPWRSGCASFKLLLARLLKTSAGPRVWRKQAVEGVWLRGQPAPQAARAPGPLLHGPSFSGSQSRGDQAVATHQ
jgi:hypothetical protein